MPLKTQLLSSKSDIITVLYIACTESKAVGGTQQAPPTTGCQQKTTRGGGDQTSHPVQSERAKERENAEVTDCTMLNYSEQICKKYTKHTKIQVRIHMILVLRQYLFNPEFSFKVHVRAK